MFSGFLLLSIANYQSWRVPRWKRRELTPWQSIWNVLNVWNSKKYVITSLRVNKTFFSIYNLFKTNHGKTIQNTLLNLLQLIVLTKSFWSLTLLLWRKSLSHLRTEETFAKRKFHKFSNLFSLEKHIWIFRWNFLSPKVLYLSV